MKILHTIHSLNPAHGGTTYGLRGLVEALLKRGIETEVLVLDDAGSPWLDSWPCVIHAVGRGLGNYGYNPQFLISVRHLAAQCDRVIIHGLWQYHGYATRKACVASGTLYCVFPHGMLDSWFARAYRGKHLLKQLYWWMFEARVLSDAARVIFTTESELASAKQTFRPFRVKSTIAPFGIAPPEEKISNYVESFKSRNLAAAAKRTLLFLGRLHPKKGCDMLIEAFALWLGQLPEQDRHCWQLRLVGPREDKKYVQKLEDLIQRHALANEGAIVLKEPVAGDQKWEELANAEALVLPSHQENFGVVLAEAMACGTPVLISTKVNGWADIEKAGAGFAEADTVAGTQCLLNRWNRLSETERMQMKDAATAYFYLKMSAEVSATALLAALNIDTNYVRIRC